MTTPSGVPVTGDPATFNGGNAANGGSAQTPAAQPEDPYRTAFDKYLSSLEVSPEQKAASDYLNSLITQGKADNEKALGMGETLGFATGEAGRVGRQNSMAIDAAARNLEAQNGFASSKSAIAKARADFEATIYKNKQDDSTFDLSPGQVRYALNPKTGKYEQIASVDKQRDTSTVNIAGRYKLVDNQTGEVIKDLGVSGDLPSGNGGGGTLAERQANSYSKIDSLLSPGVTDESGTPYLAPDGTLTYQGFNTLVEAARSAGISRKAFLAEYGPYLQVGVDGKYNGYGLTQAEINALKGK